MEYSAAYQTRSLSFWEHNQKFSNNSDDDEDLIYSVVRLITARISERMDPLGFPVFANKPNDDKNRECQEKYLNASRAHAVAGFDSGKNVPMSPLDGDRGSISKPFKMCSAERPQLA
jgi:hypothetical protein